MIKKLFSGQINSITIAALLVALSSLVSRFLGIFRDRILAGEFGASDTLDVYYTAFRIPDLIFNLLVLGALSAGFVPILACLIKDPTCKNRLNIFKSPNKEAWELSSNLLNILALSLMVFCTLGFFLSPWLMKVIAPGFDPEKQAMASHLSKIMFFSPFFLGLSSVFGGILQSFKRFFIYSLSPIFYNVGIIIGALYFVPHWGVSGLAWGVVMGAVFHLLVQLPAVYALGYRYVPKINFKDSNIRKIAFMMIPRTMSLAIAQINLLVITVIASTLSEGSISIFNFANNLQFFPISIFGISFAVAAFPVLSRLAFNKTKLIENFSQVFRQILFFIIPSTVLLLTLRAQIIRVVLGTGNFDWEDTVLTINTLGFFTISLFAQASIPLLVRMYYARHDSKTPFIIGLISAVLNVVLAFSLTRNFGTAGLALAFSVANILNFVLLWIFLKFELGNLDEKRILISSIKFSLSAIACGITVQGVKLLVGPMVDMTKVWGVFLQGALAGSMGLVVYLAFSALFKSEEYFQFWNSIKRKLNWKKVETNDQGEARGI